MRESTKLWVEFAQSELKAAEGLIDDSSIYNVVLFHCHQTVEKILKAVLEENKIDIPYIHDIETIYNSIPENIKSVLKFPQDEIKCINEVYSISRYPTDNGPNPSDFSTKGEVEEILLIAKNIYKDVMKILENSNNEQSDPEANEPF